MLGLGGPVVDEQVVGAFEIVASPVQFEGQPLSELRPAPALGAEGDDVLRELGLSDDEIIELKIAGGAAMTET